MARDWGSSSIALLVALVAASCSMPNGVDTAAEAAPDAQEQAISTETAPPPSPTGSAGSTKIDGAPDGAPGGSAPWFEIYIGDQYPYPESEPSTNPDGSAGSGCQPPAGDGLPDGLWRGYAVLTSASTIEFDLVCSYTFDSARYLEADVPDVGFTYVTRNANPKVRTLTLAPDARGYTKHSMDKVATVEEAVTPGVGADGDVWIAINGGLVTQVMETYFP